MSEPGLIRRAYDATWGRAFAASYDRMMAKAEEGELGRQRERALAEASGRTLEIGAGTGLNLRRYPAAVTELVLTEPFEPMARRLREKVADPAGGHREAEVIEAPAEELPFEDASFDTVVATLVLCTVEDQERTLSEIARVLRPGGRFLFFEHVRAATPGLARAQDIFHGPWFAVGHGCHCNRDTPAALERSPLEVERLETDELSGVAPLVRPAISGSALRSH